MSHKTFQNTSTLEIIEDFAFDYNLVRDEDHLSELFDELVAPTIIDQYGPDDEPAIREAFSNFADSLVSDGELHPMQYSEYDYVGHWS